MSNAKELTAGNFKAEVAQGVTLVDFWAEWCGPCRMVAPVLDALAADYAGKAAVGKVNVDNERDIAAEFGVQSIPTLVIMKDGAEQRRFVGVTSRDNLAKALDEALA